MSSFDDYMLEDVERRKTVVPFKPYRSKFRDKPTQTKQEAMPAFETYLAAPPPSAVQVEQVNQRTAPQVQRPAQGTAVDLNFLKGVEGFKTDGYIPKKKDGTVLGQSGVTIASGFDLGQHTAKEIQELVGPELAKKLVPYAGLKLDQADKFLAANPLKLTRAEADQVNAAVKPAKIKAVATEYEKATGKVFGNLPPEWQTVIASVAFQYGDLPRKTPNFWRQITTEDWQGAYENLRKFGDDYGERRNQEADLVAHTIGAAQ